MYCIPPPSMDASRQKYWSGYPFPSPEDLPNQGLNPGLLHCRQILYHLSHLYLINSLYCTPGESLDLSSKSLSLSLAMFSLLPTLLRFSSFFFLFLISMTLLSSLEFQFGSIENSVVFLSLEKFFFFFFKSFHSLEILKFPLRSVVYFIRLFC